MHYSERLNKMKQRLLSYQITRFPDAEQNHHVKRKQRKVLTVCSRIVKHSSRWGFTKSRLCTV